MTSETTGAAELPEALRLAECLEKQFPKGTAQDYLDGEAAACLRHLHAKVETLSAAHTQADSHTAPEYVGNGMFKGETIQKAAEHWANWCDRRCMTGLSEFLRVVAAQAADSVLEDAQRYRWLRHGDNDEKVLYNGPVAKDYWYLLRGEKLDAAIDAAMAAQREVKP